jgi:hydrogenase maturation protease HycI
MEHIIDSCKIIEEVLIKSIDKNSRIAIIGVGNEIRHDDVAGLQIVRNLKEKISELKPSKNILLVEGETAPHMFINEIQDWTPTYVIMLDSAELKKAPGTVEIVREGEMHRFSTSSHSGSKQILLDFLKVSIPDIKIIIIGIQAEKITFEEGMTENVKKAVDKLTEIFVNAFLK